VHVSLSTPVDESQVRVPPTTKQSSSSLDDLMEEQLFESWVNWKVKGVTMLLQHVWFFPKVELNCTENVPSMFPQVLTKALS